MTRELTVDDLVEIRKFCREELKTSNNERDKLFQDGVISRSEFDLWRVRNQKVENAIADFSVAILITKLSQLNTDQEDAKKKILGATSRLEDAHQRLQKLGDFLDFLGDLADLFVKIVSAITSSSLAEISGILSGIDELFNR